MPPALIAACAGAALSVATNSWVSDDMASPLATEVDQAFSLLIAGLSQPERPAI